MTDAIVRGDVFDVLPTIPDESAQCVITSPPYWGLRDYGVANQLGLEKTPEEYVDKMVKVFREVRRILRKDGTLWLNIGDSYNGSGQGGVGSFDKERPGWRRDKHPVPVINSNSNLKPKDLCGIPWRVAFALQADGWWLRQDIIWSKPNPMPESVTDRCTKSHEYIFLLSKSAKYYSNFEALKEKADPSSWGLDSNGNYFGDDTKDYKKAGVQKPSGIKKRLAKKYRDSPEYAGGGSNLQGHSGNRGADGTVYIMRNPRSVWKIPTQPTGNKNQSDIDHFATFPEELVRRCMLAGSKEGDTIFDPFMGSGTVALVALRGRRHYLGIELNPAYIEIAERRLARLKSQEVLL